MKMRNKAISFVLVAAMLILMALPIFASEQEISPYLNNTATTEASLSINDSGYATVSFLCRGYRGITTKIVVTSVIEKQVGSSWVSVDGASWTDESTLYYCSKSHSVQLQSQGTYKATVTFTVYGSGGDADVITREIEKTY